MRKFTVTLRNGTEVTIEAESLVLSTSYMQQPTDGAVNEDSPTAVATKQVPLPVLEFNSRAEKRVDAKSLAQVLKPGMAQPRSPGDPYDSPDNDKWVCVGAIFEPWSRVTSMPIKEETTTSG